MQQPDNLMTVGSDVSREISRNDTMFAGDDRHYFSVGQSALDCIRCGLHAARLPVDRVRRILDLPCGHGRVLRYLKAAFPDAEIAACDLLRDGVDFCAATFGTRPIYSDEDPRKVVFDENTFDLIWVGSLFTHLGADRWPDFLELFRRSLRNGGLLIFTTHGRRAYDRAVQEFHYGLPYWRNTAVLYGYEQSGFGYANYLSDGSYGHSLSRPDWVFRQIERFCEMRLVYFSEAAWDGIQDVYGCVRDPDWQVRLPSTSTLAFLKHRIREWVRPGGERPHTPLNKAIEIQPASR